MTLIGFYRIKHFIPEPTVHCKLFWMQCGLQIQWNYTFFILICFLPSLYAICFHSCKKAGEQIQFMECNKRHKTEVHKIVFLKVRLDSNCYVSSCSYEFQWPIRLEYIWIQNHSTLETQNLESRLKTNETINKRNAKFTMQQ